MEKYYRKLSTNNWEILLPEDWQQADVEDTSKLYFESGDKTKGFYIATWAFSDEETRSDEEIASEFIEVDRKSFYDMEGYKWVTHEFSSEKDEESTINTIDNYDESNGYRIACRVITDLPKLIRVAFHDYQCQDFSKSKAESDVIFKSIKILQSA